jgi:hypothetical protein
LRQLPGGNVVRRKALTLLVLAAVLGVGYRATVPTRSTDSDAAVLTEWIELRPDAASIDWTVKRADSTEGCTASAWIRQDGVTQPLATLYAVRLVGAGEGTETGRTSLDGIAPGRYLVDFGGAGCMWTIIVSPER